MATLVCFHAHPDDEAIATGGTMARARAEGHRVVLVVATDGAHGEVPDDLGPGETLVDRRRSETECSARVLGVERVAWLGYTDSGMTGWPQNDDPACFHQADQATAAGRLADILIAEGADALTIYDWHGNYGHPDHIQVHRVGVLAAEAVAERLPGLRVFEATMNRDEFVRMMAEVAEAAEAGEADESVAPGDVSAGPDNGAGAGSEFDFDPNGPADDGNPMGMPEADLTHEIDVSEHLEAKRNALACHRSQVSDSSFFLTMDPAMFHRAFGREWFIERGRPAPGQPGGGAMRAGWLFDEGERA